MLTSCAQHAADGAATDRGALTAAGRVDAGRGERVSEIAERVERALDHGRLLAYGGPGSWSFPQATIALLFVDEVERSTALSEAMLHDARERGSVRGYVVGLGLRMYRPHTRAGNLNDAEVDLRHLRSRSSTSTASCSASRPACGGGSRRSSNARTSPTSPPSPRPIELPPGLGETVSGAWVLESQGRLRSVAGDRAGAAKAIRAAAERSTAV